MRKTTLALVGALALSTLVLVAGCSGSSIPAPKGLPARTRSVSVFFSSGRSLFEERRVVDAGNVYAGTLKELLAANPQTNSQVAVVQPTARVRSVRFKDGTIAIDWSRDVLSFAAEPKEKLLAWAAIMTTFGQFREVKKVTFTVEGKTNGMIDGKDIRKFWGRIGLAGQPWNVIRIKNKTPKGQ